MSEEEKELTCLRFIYRILNEKWVQNRFCTTRYGNILEDKTVTLKQSIDCLINIYKEKGGKVVDE